MDEQRDTAVIEARLLRLEERLDRIELSPARRGRAFHPLWPFLAGIAALGFGYTGMGLPNHAYQPLFAGLVLVFLYHRGTLETQPGRWTWPFLVVNFLSLCLLFKVLIGAGTTYPFHWLKAPSIGKSAPQEGGSWFGNVMPDLDLQWQAIPQVTDWGFDLTRIQTFLLIATLAGALFRFQPFASMTALALMIVSIPTYLGFQWDWVVPFFLCAGLSFYLQTAIHAGRPAQRQ